MTILLESNDATPRHALPRLHVAQAQKELFVNEAFEAIDWLIAPDIEGVLASPDGLAAQPGQGWIVSSAASGEWAGMAHHFAVRTAGGWRFHAPRTGQTATLRSNGCVMRFDGNEWRAASAVPLVDGGSVQDSESRAAIAAISDILRRFGFAI